MGLLSFHDHCNQSDPVFLCTGRQRVARLRSITSLTGYHSLVISGIVGIQHLMAHGNGPCRRLFRGGNLIRQRRGRLYHRRILKSRPGNQRHIPWGRIMLLIVQTVRIYKMGICTSQFLGPGVHLIGKRRHASGDMLCQSIGHFVGRL